MKTPLLILSTALLLTSLVPVQATTGHWDEIIGKTVVNAQGQKLGSVVDSVVDLENGRYYGMVVASGGFLGIGATRIIVPPPALQDHGIPHRLHLDMSLEKFRAAPVYELPGKVGPPDSTKVAEVFRYFGQVPPFAVRGERNPPGAKPLGYLRKTSRILLMPVENLQGVEVGYVKGLRGLDRNAQTIEGVVVDSYNSAGQMKIVPPQALRYSLEHNKLRINDHAQAFRDSANFDLSPSGLYREENPARPGVPTAPLVQGESASDRAMTANLAQQISADRKLGIYGKNLEIATLNGKMTLRGRVATEDNRNRVIAYANQIAGASNVTASIQVSPMSDWEKSIDR